MKFVVLRRMPGADKAELWERIGATDVAEEGADMPEQRAVNEVAREGGVYLAIPMGDWLLFEVEARLEVRPVLRPEQIADQEAEVAVPSLVQGEEETDEDFEARGGIVMRGAFEEMEGLRRPRTPQ